MSKPVSMFYRLVYFLKDRPEVVKKLRDEFRVTRINVCDAIWTTDMPTEAVLWLIIRKTGHHEHVTDALRRLVADYDKQLAGSTLWFEAACGMFDALAEADQDAFRRLNDEELSRLKILLSRRPYDGPDWDRMPFGDIENMSRLALNTAMTMRYGERMARYCVPALTALNRLDLLRCDER